jgi:hypothetical protein
MVCQIQFGGAQTELILAEEVIGQELLLNDVKDEFLDNARCLTKRTAEFIKRVILRAFFFGSALDC